DRGLKPKRLIKLSNNKTRRRGCVLEPGIYIQSSKLGGENGKARGIFIVRVSFGLKTVWWLTGLDRVDVNCRCEVTPDHASCETASGFFSTSRSLRASDSRENGFCRKPASGESSSCCATAFSG